MIPYTPPKPATSLPLIDISRAPAAVAWEIHKACRDTGFFYVVNHRIPEEVLGAQLDWARRFFALDAADKNAISFDRSPRRMGFEPMRRQVLDEGSAPDLKESFMYSAPPPKGAVAGDVGEDRAVALAEVVALVAVVVAGQRGQLAPSGTTETPADAGAQLVVELLGELGAHRQRRRRTDEECRDGDEQHRDRDQAGGERARSEEHTSELQSH